MTETWAERWRATYYGGPIVLVAFLTFPLYAVPFFIFARGIPALAMVVTLGLLFVLNLAAILYARRRQEVDRT